MMSLRIPPEMIERMDRFRESQPVVPPRTAVMLAALERFLDEHEKADAPAKAGKKGSGR